jgi:hypothetical protein
MEEVGKLLYENGLEADWFNPKLYASSSMEASLINAKQAPAFTERVGGHSSSNPTNHDKKRANLFSIIDEELPPLFNARVEGISNPQERLEWKAKYDKLAYALADYERPASGAVKAKLGATLREAEFAFGEESKAARMAVENIVDSAIKKAFGRSR